MLCCCVVVSCVCGSEAGFVARCDGVEGRFVSERGSGGRLRGGLCLSGEMAAGWRDSIIITSWRISETDHVARMVHCYGQQT
jgi:hypothetical protein